MMVSIEESVEVEVPVRTAYNQWTQFEEFPQFMDGVESVRQVDDTHLHWVAEVGGKRREWDAEITEQVPDDRIAWTATDGKRNAGVVTFHRVDDDRTKIMLQLDWEPEGMVEALGAKAGQDARQVKSDLAKFKELIESRGTESGAWRGEVQHAPWGSDRAGRAPLSRPRPAPARPPRRSPQAAASRADRTGPHRPRASTPSQQRLQHAMHRRADARQSAPRDSRRAERRPHRPPTPDRRAAQPRGSDAHAVPRATAHSNPRAR